MFFKYFFLLLFYVLVLSFLTSCEYGTNPETNYENIDTLYSSTHFLWPSTIGSNWDYNFYQFSNHFSSDSNWTYQGFNSFGIDFDTIKITPSLYRLEIIDSVFININDTVYECHVFDGYYPVTNTYKNLRFPFWVSEKGIYTMGVYVAGKDSLFNKGLYIPSEISLNENWGGQISYRIGGNYLETSSVIERKCLTKDEIINTPMGKFKCYVIYTRTSQAYDIAGYYDFYDYYAPDVGLVCTVRLAVTPILGPDSYGWWWLNYISIINNYSIN